MIRRVLVRLVIVVAVSASLLAVRLHDDPEHVRPPHVERPTAGVAAAQDEPDALGAQADAQALWIETEQRERAELERRAADERLAGTRRPPNVTVVGGGDCETLSTELGVSTDVLWRESRCQWVDNPNGCGGRGCLGPAQIDAGHFAAVSPWNNDVPGVCYGLSYAECARILPDSAWR